jgi:uncharacterized RDD family membrane protein YckC
MADVELVTNAVEPDRGNLIAHRPNIFQPTGSPGQRPSGRSKKRRDSVQALDNTMRVTTPENISFEYQVAGPFQRSQAYLLDVIITISGFSLLSLLAFLLMTFVIIPLAVSIGLGGLVETIAGILVGFILVLYFLVYWFYGAYMETMFNGQTLGKRWMGLRVLSVNGHAIDGVQATLRNFFRLLDVWPVVSLGMLIDLRDIDPDFELFARGVGFPTFLVALVVMSFSRRFQRVGDFVADTIVIKETKSYAPQLITFDDPRVPMLAELIPNFAPTNSFAKAIASYADLRRNIYPQRANEIAAHIAVPLLEKYGLQPDTNYDLFLCALYYKLFAPSKESGDYLANLTSVTQIAHHTRKAADKSESVKSANPSLKNSTDEITDFPQIRTTREGTNESR